MFDITWKVPRGTCSCLCKLPFVDSLPHIFLAEKCFNFTNQNNSSLLRRGIRKGKQKERGRYVGK